MQTIALTGGIAMGKSTAAAALQAEGIPVVDSDDLARVVVEPGQPALSEIAAEFGIGVLSETGELRREELARLVFASPEARRKLEAITHPRIRTLWRARLEAWKKDEAKCGVVVIPLLFEIGAEAEFDRVVCVACSAGTQADRLRARGWSATECRQRLAAQLPIESKMARAHYVVWTEGKPEIMQAQFARLFAD
jgi:dephospho-CoA kinase